jgi:hypothetical protein
VDGTGRKTRRVSGEDAAPTTPAAPKTHTAPHTPPSFFFFLLGVCVTIKSERVRGRMEREDAFTPRLPHPPGEFFWETKKKERGVRAGVRG